MEYQRDLPDVRMVNAHRAMDSELLQTRADLLHNRQVFRNQFVVRNGFSGLLLDHASTLPDARSRCGVNVGEESLRVR
jgi:hypothetical protein